jgi:phosphate starvation-inducible PhoH-like protein
MAKRPARNKPTSRHQVDDLEAMEAYQTVTRRPAAPAPLESLTEAQKRYMGAIKTFPLVYGLGPAGTGKTYVCTAMAAQALLEGRAEKIILTRPAVEAEEELGFLPGDLSEKYAPWLGPFLDVLNERLGKKRVEYLLKSGGIVASPLAYMRGHTFRNAFVILDEAQNTTPGQMKLFLTRIGNNSTVVVNGDASQKDIKGPSGLADGVRRTSHIPSVKVVKFTKKDIVRSGLVQEIVEAYEQSLEELDANQSAV